MRCENCGAPVVASSNHAYVCTYCGSAVEPKRKVNSVGSLVDQVLGEVQLGANVSASVTRKNVHFVRQSRVSVNGTQYDNLEQLPPELQQAVGRGLAIAEQLGQTGGASASTTVSVASSTVVENAEREPSNGIAARRIIVALVVVLMMLVATLVGVLLT